MPVLRAGRTLGVLVVQNRSYRTYTEEELEALQTTAMVLAEMFASGEMEDIAIPGADLDVNRPVHLKGVGFAEGIALGHVVLHEPRVVVTQLIAEDVEHELRRLEAAMASLQLSVDDLLARGAEVGRRRAPRDPRSLQDVRRGSRLDAAAAGGDQATASPPRRRSSACRTTRARRWRGRPIRSCATGCTISTISPTGCCAS